MPPSEHTETCPHCAADLRGSRIPQEAIDAGMYGPPTTEPLYFYRTIGVEVRGVYDGVLYWKCPECGGTWHRWPNEGYTKGHHEAAAKEMAKETANG